MKPVKDALPMTLLGARLRALRQQRGLTQSEMAKKLSVDRTTYTKYENGRVSPDHQALVCIAELHGVTVDFLLGRDDVPASLSVADSREHNVELTLSEMRLLQMFRQLSEEEKKALITQIDVTYHERKRQKMLP